MKPRIVLSGPAVRLVLVKKNRLVLERLRKDALGSEAWRSDRHGIWVGHQEEGLGNDSEFLSMLDECSPQPVAPSPVLRPYDAMTCLTWGVIMGMALACAIEAAV